MPALREDRLSGRAVGCRRTQLAQNVLQVLQVRQELGVSCVCHWRAKFLCRWHSGAVCPSLLLFLFSSPSVSYSPPRSPSLPLSFCYSRQKNLSCALLLAVQPTTSSVRTTAPCIASSISMKKRPRPLWSEVLPSSPSRTCLLRHSPAPSRAFRFQV